MTKLVREKCSRRGAEIAEESQCKASVSSEYCYKLFLRALREKNNMFKIMELN
jgi:hypothetical protein